MKLKRTKKLLSIALALMITASAAPIPTILPLFENTAITAEAAAPAILYMSRRWDGTKVVSKVETCSDPTAIVSTSTTWKSGWYIVNKNVTINKRITVEGDVHLILCDGCTLKAEGGIKCGDNNTLNIYAQSKNTGKLIATASGTSLSPQVGSALAGIGGDDGQQGGNITVYGGDITAKAAISGGCGAAGIGGGAGGTGTGGVFTMYAGKVNAEGTGTAAGIGGGNFKAAGTITIYGGTVHAKGGSGIGSATNLNPDDLNKYGSGKGDVSADISIYGGNISLEGTECALKGCVLENHPESEKFNHIFLGQVKVKAKNSNTYYLRDERLSKAQTEKNIVMEPCTNTHTYAHDETSHWLSCDYCEGIHMPHDAKGDTCGTCGYKKTAIKPEPTDPSPSFFYDKHIKECSSAEELRKLLEEANDGDVIRVSKDFDVSSFRDNEACVNQYATVTLDLNGHELTFQYANDAIGTHNGSVLLVKNGTFDYFDTSNKTGKSDGIFILDNVTVTKTAWWFQSIVWAVNGCSFKESFEENHVTKKATAYALRGLNQTWTDCSAEDAFNKAESNQKILLLKDRQLSADANLKVSGVITDFAQYTLNTGKHSLAVSHSSGTNTLRNGTINGDLTLTSGEGTVKLENMAVTGTIKNTAHPVNIGSGCYNNITTSSGKVTISGGYFMGALTGTASSYDITGGYFVTAPSSAAIRNGYCVEDCEETYNGTTYTKKVVKKPISIHSQPSDLALTFGYASNNKIAVTVDKRSDCSDYALNYQWYQSETNSTENGTAISGATSSSYTIPTGKPANTTEYYYCVITATKSGCDSISVTSNTAKVTVGKATTRLSASAKSTIVYDGKPLDYSDFTFSGQNANLANAQNVTVKGVDASTPDGFAIVNAGTYTAKITVDLGTNYNPIELTVNGVKVAPKSVTITGLSASNKEYDGTTKATVTGTAIINGKLDNDDVTVKAGSAAFDNANAGTDKTVTFSGYSLSGAKAGNYQLSAQPANTKATISPKSVTITGLSASNKTYDGTTNAAVTGTANISGIIGNDEVSVSAGSAAFADKNVGTDKTVTFSGYSLSGSAAGNYELSAQPASVTASITAAPLTITAKSKTITYGDEPANDGVTYSGLVNGERENDENVLSGTLAYAYNYNRYDNAGGDYTITPSGLTSSNYEIEFKPGKLTVDRKPVSISWENTALTYNGSAQAPTASATGLVHGDTCTIEVSGAQTDAGTGYTAEAVSLSNQNYVLPAEEADRQTAFSIGEATIANITPPKALNPARSSGSVKLIQPGSVENGTMYYSIGTKNAAGDTWEADANKITANKAGTYYVWYKVEGNKNYADTAADFVTVKVTQRSTYYSQSWRLSMKNYVFDGVAHLPEFIGNAYGEITYTFYNDDTDEELSEAPIEPGNYRVKVFAEGGARYYNRTLEISFSILSPFDKNGMADVSAFKKNNIIPKCDGKVFAGWFTNSSCKTPFTGNSGKAYAKFIDNKILTVKAQISNGTMKKDGSTAIRFITSLDSLKYLNVGFKITFNGKTIEQKLTKVYSALLANGKKVNPGVFCEASHYMSAFTLNNIPQSAFGQTFTVTPYYTTEDGTVVDGETSTYVIADMIK